MPQFAINAAHIGLISPLQISVTQREMAILGYGATTFQSRIWRREMKYRFAQRTMAMTLVVSLTSGLAMNAVMYDFAYAQQTGGSGNGNSSNTNGNSGNSNGNGASTSTGNQGNGNSGNTNGNSGNSNGNGSSNSGGNQGNGNGNGNQGNGNGNQGNGNGNFGNSPRTGDDGGSNDSYYDGRDRNPRAKTAKGPNPTGDRGNSERARQPAPFEKTLARLFSVPGHQKVREQEVASVAPKPKATVKRRPSSKTKVAGQVPAANASRPSKAVTPQPVETAMIIPGGSVSGGDLEGSFGTGGAAAVTDAAFPPQGTGRNPVNDVSGGSTANQGQGNQTVGLDASSFDESDTAQAAPDTRQVANAGQGRAVSSQATDGSTETAETTSATQSELAEREMASVSMRPAVKGTLLSGARASLASALKSLAGGQENAAALTDAAPESFPGMLNSYRVAALIEIERKAVFDNAATVTSVASKGAMEAELGMLAALRAQ